MKKEVQGILVGFMTLVVCVTSGITGYSIGKNEALEEVAAKKNIDSGFVVTLPEEDSGIELATAEIGVEDYEVYGVSEKNAESVQTITATITPIGAANRNLIWTIDWVGATTSWGGSSEKDINEYVSMQIGEFDATAYTQTVTLSCLGCFGTQIQVTVMPEGLPSLKKTITLDYLQKITSVDLNIGTVDVNLDGDTAIELELGPDQTGDGGLIECNYETSAFYTIADTFTCNLASAYYVSENESGVVSTEFALKGKDFITSTFSSFGNNIGNTIYFDYVHLVKDWYIAYGTEGFTKFSDMTQAEMESYFDEITQPYFARLNLSITGTHSSYAAKCDFYVSGYRNSVDINSFEVDKDSVIF